MHLQLKTNLKNSEILFSPMFESGKIAKEINLKLSLKRLFSRFFHELIRT